MSDDSDLNYQDDGIEFEPATEVDTPEVEEQEQEAETQDTSTGEDEKPESDYVDFSKLPEDMRKPIEKRIGHLYRESMKAKKLEARLAELESKLATPKEIPEVKMPDADLAIENPTEFVRQNQAYIDYQSKLNDQKKQSEADAERLKQTQAQELQERLSNFNRRADSKKIDKGLIQAGAALLDEAGVAVKVGDLILDDEDGPDILVYLNNDFEAVDMLSRLPQHKAIQYLERVIRPKATAKKKPSAPPPPTKVQGTRGTGKTVVDKHGFSVE
jgi:hypothetical protein